MSTQAGVGSGDAALDRLVLSGRERVVRGRLALLAAGAVAGVEAGFGVLAFLLVHRATGSTSLAALAFTLAFVAVVLDRAELFTEGVLGPVVAVAAGGAGRGRLLGFWLLTLAGNLVGGWVTAWLVVAALPALRASAVVAGAAFATAPLTWRTFAMSLLAGAAVALLSRLRDATDDAVARLVVGAGVALVLLAGGLLHSVFGSVFAFAGLHTGAPYGYGEWFVRLLWTVVGNVAGGLALVTSLRLVESRDRLHRWRDAQVTAAASEGGAPRQEAGPTLLRRARGRVSSAPRNDGAEEAAAEAPEPEPGEDDIWRPPPRE